MLAANPERLCDGLQAKQKKDGTEPGAVAILDRSRRYVHGRCWAWSRRRDFVRKTSVR